MPYLIRDVAEKDCVFLQNASAFFDLLPLPKCSIRERIRTPSQVEEPRVLLLPGV
jgi:hypothetical protein